MRDGQIVLMPHGHASAVYDDATVAPQPLGTVLNDTTTHARVIEAGEGPATARLLCGGFAFERRAWSPLLSFLPPLVPVTVNPAINAVLEAIDHEIEAMGPGGDIVLERLSEALFVHLMREVSARVPDAGFVAGMRDEVVARTLTAVHTKPAHGWTLDTLARRAGASRSALTQRFRAQMGTSPRKHLAQWRVVLATTLLRETSMSVDEIAERVGYDSTASFSRLFKRITGLSPGRYRREGDHAREELYRM